MQVMTPTAAHACLEIDVMAPKARAKITRKPIPVVLFALNKRQRHVQCIRIEHDEMLRDASVGKNLKNIGKRRGVANCRFIQQRRSMCSRSSTRVKGNSPATAKKHRKWRNSILVFSRHWLIGHFLTSALIVVKRSQYEYPGHGRSTS
jgi:hypothetical protein